MPEGKDIDPTYYGMSKTEKGPDYYPGEVKHGTYGDCADMKSMPGSGQNNLSPPNAASMGGAMTGSGLPPAQGINLGIEQPRPNPCPPGCSVEPAMGAGPTGESTLPPGVPCGDHNVGNPGQLPPGPPVGTAPPKGPRDS